MELEGIMLNELSQSKRQLQGDLAYMHRKEKGEKRKGLDSP